MIDAETRKPISAAIQKLNRESEAQEVENILSRLSTENISRLQTDEYLKDIKDRTIYGLTGLRAQLSQLEKDVPNMIANKVLERHYNNGKHLVRNDDKCFWSYNGKHWEPISDELLQNRIHEVVENTLDEGKSNFACVMRDALALMIAKCSGTIDPLQFRKRQPPVINCQNGEIWINEDGTYDFKEHKAESNLKYVLDVEYHKEALCPRFDQALLDIFASSGDPVDMRRHLFEIFGYLIQPSRFLCKWFMFIGLGCNGKTKVFQTLERLMNPKAIYSGRIAELNTNRFLSGELREKLIFYDDDLDTGTKLPDGMLKKYSEDKLVSGALKFGNSFEYISTLAIVMLMNNYPMSADNSHGFKRRASVIPFDRIFSEDDRDDTLFPFVWKNEMPGILNRSLEGLQRLHERGTLLDPLDCKSALQDMLVASNPLEAFVHQRCEGKREARTVLSSFRRDYENWLANNGYTKHSLTSHMLRRNLQNMGYEVIDTSGQCVVHGLGVKETPNSAGIKRPNFLR